MDSWIVTDADIKGGEPVIRGTRVSVYVIADRVADRRRRRQLERARRGLSAYSSGGVPSHGEVRSRPPEALSATTQTPSPAS